MWRSPTPPNSSGNVQRHGHLLRFQVSGRQGKISGVHLIDNLKQTLRPRLRNNQTVGIDIDWDPVWPAQIGEISFEVSLHWRHNYHDGVSNHQPHGCLFNRSFRRRSKKTSKLRVTGLCVGNSPGPVNSSHKGPVTRKMFPFDYVIMLCVSSDGYQNYISETTTFS